VCLNITSFSIHGQHVPSADFTPGYPSSSSPLYQFFTSTHCLSLEGVCINVSLAKNSLFSKPLRVTSRLSSNTERKPFKFRFSALSYVLTTPPPFLHVPTALWQFCLFCLTRANQRLCRYSSRVAISTRPELCFFSTVVTPFFGLFSQSEYFQILTQLHVFYPPAYHIVTAAVVSGFGNDQPSCRPP